MTISRPAFLEHDDIATKPMQIYGFANNKPVRINSDDTGSIAVYGMNHICLDNTTTVSLGANETFTGDWQDVMDYQEVNVSVDTDQNSATNGLIFQWSADASTVADTDVFSVYANSGTNYTPNPAFRYVRIVYTNGATPQTRFSLMTILRRSMTGGSFHRIDSTLKDDSDARLNITVPKLKTAANTYVSQTATTAGNAKVSLEELESGISTNNKSQLKVSIYDEGGQPASIDDNTNTLQVIDYSHHEIHSGYHFEYCEVVDQALNNVYDIRITTPNTTKWSHFLFNLGAEAETEYFLYESVAITVAGSALTPKNSDRNSSNSPTLTLDGISNTSVANANLDTNLAGSVTISHGIIGAGRDAGFFTREQELILKQNTVYCIRIIANAAGYANHCLEWYEHTNN